MFLTNAKKKKCFSCLGQNLATSLFIGEITFAIVIGVLGLVLFALLIGNMQVRTRSFCSTICAHRDNHD
jgi:hypothetical protein